jgi:intracellular sulfur oxidation DsrE/DsrF family protein
MTRMVRPLLLAACVMLAFGCASSSGPFAATPAATMSPAPALKADIEPQVASWKTVVYANRRPTADMVFYGLADWRDATDAAKAAGAKEISLIVVFDGPALPLTLGDAAYDRVMGTKAGNPWKSLVADLQKAGAGVEACGTRMKELGVGNTDLLPGVKVDSDGWTRVVELHSKGYTVFQN